MVTTVMIIVTNNRIQVETCSVLHIQQSLKMAKQMGEKQEKMLNSCTRMQES